MAQNIFRPTIRSVKRNALVGAGLILFGIIFLQVIEPGKGTPNWHFGGLTMFVGGFFLMMRSLTPIFFTHMMKIYAPEYSERYLKSTEIGFVIMRETMLIRDTNSRE